MGREILKPKQVEFLELFSESNLADFFYLSGGTALAAFYLNHRESEDLDFFSEEEVDPLAVETFLKHNKRRIGFDTLEFQSSFNRNLFFLNFGGDVLKTEFTYFPFPRIEKGKKEGKLQIDSLRDIAVNKLFTISQQIRARDFVDFYFILKDKKLDLGGLIGDVRAKFDANIDAIQLGSQFFRVDEAKDEPRMLVPLDKDKMRLFFREQSGALKKEILK